MWGQEEVSSLEALAPRSAADRQVLFRLIREELKRRFPSREGTVARMSLVGVRYLSGEGPRVLLRGPVGSRRHALVRGFADVLDVPFVELEAASLAATNWAGSDLPFFLSSLRTQIAERYDPAKVPALAERACILVSNLDHSRLATSYVSASTRDHLHGQQLALAQLVQGGPIPVSTSTHPGFIWRGSRALVFVTGQFDEIRAEWPSSADLESWGMLQNLADAIANGVVIRVEAPSSLEIRERLHSHLDRMTRRFLEFGYHLRVEEQVVRYVADVVEDGLYGGGVAAGAGWIEAAVERALIRLLEAGARPGIAWVLARDDISLPDPPKGVWRE